MTCGQCGSDNPAGMKFCGSCGQRLALACPSCGFENARGFKFCGECGASLAAPAPASPPPSPALPPSRVEPAEAGERRQLTVLFCDLVGSTELSGRLDPEEWRELVAAYQKATSAVVARFGGHVAQYLGDGVLVYFGYPTAHDDDAERAVRTGLAVIDALREVNAKLGVDRQLAVRIGIHTGPVVVSELGGKERREMLAVGETTNLAARVQGVAEPDSVAITAATHRLVAGLFVVEDRGTQTLKGIATPVGLFRVMQASGVRGRLAAATDLTPFVGREREREALAEVWERTQDGEGQVVLLVGEAGIGKSRLVQELKASLAQTPHTWIESGGAAYYESAPLHVVVDLLRQGFGWTADQSTEARLDTLDRALVLVGLKAEEAAPVIAPLLDLWVPEGRYPPLFLSPEQERKRLLATLVAWTCGAARLQPTVMVVEDLHWVDPSTLELLGLLVEQGARVPLMLVLTARPEFRAPWPLRSHHTQLSLNRLTRRQVHEMIVRVAVRVIPPGEMLEALAVRTDGVPLFVEELTRAMMEEEGVALTTRAIPPTLQDTLMARLDRLGPAKEPAQIAAVIGREFSYALLHAVSGLDEEVLQAALAQLADAELVYVRGLPPEATYAFKHALIQDTAYESLLKTRRRELHRVVAEALTGRFSSLVEAQPEVVAQHWETAGETEQAVGAWQQAGDRAKARNAMTEAERHYRRALFALETLPETPVRVSQEVGLQVALDHVVGITRGFASAEREQIRRRVRDLSAQAGDTRQFVFSLIMAWALPMARGEQRAALALAEQALAAARNDGSHFALSWSHYALAQSQYLFGQLDAALENATAALRFYRQEDHSDWPTEPGAPAQGIVAWVCAQRGCLQRAQRETETLLAREEQLPLPSQRALLHVCAASVHVLARDLRAVADHAHRVITLAAENDLAQYSGWGHVFRGWALALDSRMEEGIAELREGLTGYAASGARSSAGEYLGWLAETHLLAGRLNEGLATIDEALTAVPEQRVNLPELLRLRGELRAAAGADVATVEASFEEAIALAREIGTKLVELRATTGLARFLARHGRKDEARVRLVPLYTWFTEGFDAPDLVDAKSLLAELRG